MSEQNKENGKKKNVTRQQVIYRSVMAGITIICMISGLILKLM